MYFTGRPTQHSREVRAFASRQRWADLSRAAGRPTRAGLAGFFFAFRAAPVVVEHEAVFSRYFALQRVDDLPFART